MKIFELIFVFVFTLKGFEACSDKGGKCIFVLSSCSGSVISSSECSFYQKCCFIAPPTIRPTGLTQVPVTTGCGATFKPAEPPVSRVIGGEASIKGAWPWQISLQYSGKHMCGGSVLSGRWIITAAHCFLKSTNPLYYKIRVGEHNFNVNNEDHFDMGVEKIILHEKWGGIYGDLLNDIALVKLTSDIDMASHNHIGHVCMPNTITDTGDAFVGKEHCWVTGWGYVENKQKTSIMMQVNGPVISNTDCNKNNYGWMGKVKSSQVCFGTGRNAVSACQGDSGGPLTCRKIDGRYYLVGIVSWGSNTCSGRPSVFTRVTSYSEWIKNKQESN